MSPVQLQAADDFLSLQDTARLAAGVTRRGFPAFANLLLQRVLCGLQVSQRKSRCRQFDERYLLNKVQADTASDAQYISQPHCRSTLPWIPWASQEHVIATKG